jgi:hypothetical protein
VAGRVSAGHGEALGAGREVSIGWPLATVPVQKAIVLVIAHWLR